jgi:hypothetical protein
MTLPERFPLLLTNPDYATADLLEFSAVRDGFIVVTIYASIASLQALVSALLVIGNVTFGVITFFGSFFSIYVIWVVLTVFLHLASSFWGGSGDLVSTFGAVGLGAAPMIVVSVFSILAAVVGGTVLADDPESVMPLINLLMALLGAAWGWPGLMCYYTLKNVELMDTHRSMIITMVAFLLLATFEIVNSNIFSLEF